MKFAMGLMVAGCALAVGACGEEKKAAPPAPEKPQTLAAGEYEVVSEVTKLASTDKSTPATKLKQGDKATLKACVGDDGVPDAALFTEAGDKCTATSSFVRAGRISIQYQCNRAGKGNLSPSVDGNITADGFEAVVNSNSSFPATGDYQLSRHMTGKRIGNCPAAGAAKA